MLTLEMKRYIVGFVVAAAVVPWMSCQAGDGAPEKKKSSLSTTTQRQTVNPRRASSVTKARPDRMWFCQDWYCVRAAASPWWPNAPGG